jgi:phosphoserine phosphatase
MTVREVFAGGQPLTVSGVGYEPVGTFQSANGEVAIGPATLETLSAGALASDAKLHRDGERWQIEGDPTEGALVVAAAKAGLELASLERQFPRTAEIPFCSERRRMTTLHTNAGASLAYSKGAVDVVLDGCTSWVGPSGESLLTPSDRDRLREVEERMASDGLRVLAIARKHGATLTDAEHHMTLLGLVGIMDPPRPEARDAVRTCQHAGIRPVMITGDHPVTATIIARELGLLANGRVVSGHDLQAMSDTELGRQIRDISVYARVSPADKLRVIEGWQTHREVVAMTGDGVNDAPALKKADVGIAMGITGTDVSKEAAAITLLDDNFASIVAAVEEGRIVFANIKKYLTYLLSSNVGEILLMAVRGACRPAATSDSRSDPLRQPRDGWIARARARRRSSGTGPDAPQAAQSTHWHLHAPPSGAAADRRHLVGAREHQPLHVASSHWPSASRGGVDDICFAGPHSVLQGVQLPLGPLVRISAPARESMAQSGGPMGDGAAESDSVCALAAATVRHVQLQYNRLAPRHRVGAQHRSGARSGEMHGAV